MVAPMPKRCRRVVRAARCAVRDISLIDAMGTRNAVRPSVRRSNGFVGTAHGSRKAKPSLHDFLAALDVGAFDADDRHGVRSVVLRLNRRSSGR